MRPLEIDAMMMIWQCQRTTPNFPLPELGPGCTLTDSRSVRLLAITYSKLLLISDYLTQLDAKSDRFPSMHTNEIFPISPTRLSRPHPTLDLARAQGCLDNQGYARSEESGQSHPDLQWNKEYINTDMPDMIPEDESLMSTVAGARRNM